MSNQIEPLDADGKIVNPPRRLSIPENVRESFDWVLSGGKNVSSKVDITVRLLIQLFLGVIIMFGPKLVFQLIVAVFGGDDSSARSSVVGDLGHIIGVGWIAGTLAMAALHVIPRLLKLCKRQDQTMPHSAQRLVELIRTLRPYFSLMVGSAAMALVAGGKHPSVQLMEALGGGDLSAEASASAAGPDFTVVGSLTAFSKNMVTIWSTMGYSRLLTSSVYTLAIFMFVLFLEKLLLQILAFHYRTATTAGRFNDNAFALRVMKALYRAHIDPTILKAASKAGRVFDPQLTEVVFDRLVPEGATGVLTRASLKNDLEVTQAARLFSFLDVAENGDMTREEFVAAVKAIYDERATLAALITDHDNVIAKVDELLLVGVYTIDVAIGLNFLGVPAINLLQALLAVAIGFAIFFDDFFKKIFDSLVFVLITHPYDLGDRVDVKGDVYVVEEVGLWQSVFRGHSGLKTFMTNASLAHETISNYRRSPSENETFSFLCVPASVTQERLNLMRERCMSFLQDNRRDYLPQMNVDTLEHIDTERLKLVLKIFHRKNFQDEEAKNERSQKFMLYMKDVLIECGFVLSPPIPRAILLNL